MGAGRSKISLHPPSKQECNSPDRMQSKADLVLAMATAALAAVGGVTVRRLPHKQINPLCRNGQCVVCPAGAMCVVPPTIDPTTYRDCIRATVNQMGWINGSCPHCSCRTLSSEQLRVLKPTFFTRDKMWYHLHISKTGGTTFENLLRKRLAPMSGLRMCDEALHSTFQTPFRYRAHSGNKELFALPADLAGARCHVTSAEGRRQLIPEQFPSAPEILTFLRDPTLRTVSQWNHDKTYNQMWSGRSLTEHAMTANNTRDHLLLRQVPKTLADLYANRQLVSELHERYGNWQFYRLCASTYPSPAFSTHTAFQEVKTSLATFAFLGLSDHYRTSLCLLAFQFHLSVEFALCQTRPLNVYNAACYENGTTNKECAEGQAFANKFNVQSEALQRDHRRSVPPGLETVIYKHTWLDKALYIEACRIFWARVLIMEAVTGRRFYVPPLFRQRHAE
mmetsp:Transcript_18224/g.54000  ORF Transcript_18224/g.54000 Transcript_18224/m.54000 type:complete len:450 (+) Transcript_18224:258-1607(+)